MSSPPKDSTDTNTTATTTTMATTPPLPPPRPQSQQQSPDVTAPSSLSSSTSGGASPSIVPPLPQLPQLPSLATNNNNTGSPTNTTHPQSPTSSTSTTPPTTTTTNTTNTNTTSKDNTTTTPRQQQQQTTTHVGSPSPRIISPRSGSIMSTTSPMMMPMHSNNSNNSNNAIDSNNNGAITTRKKSKTFASLFKNGKKKKLKQEKEKHQALVNEWLTTNQIPTTTTTNTTSNTSSSSTANTSSSSASTPASNNTPRNSHNLHNHHHQQSSAHNQSNTMNSKSGATTVNNSNNNNNNNSSNLKRQYSFVGLDNKLEQTGLMFAHYETVHETLQSIVAKNREVSQLEMLLSKSMGNYMIGLPSDQQQNHSNHHSHQQSQNQHGEETAQSELLRKCGVHMSEALHRMSMTRANLSDRLTVDAIDKLKQLEEDNRIVEAKQHHRLNSEIDYQLARRDHEYYALIHHIMSHYISYFETALTTLKNVQNKMYDLPRVDQLPTIDRHLFDYGNEIRIFGVSMDVILQRWDEPGPVPVVIEEMLSYLEKNCLHCEGLMRITGHTGEMDRLRQLIDTGKRVDYYREEILSKPHTICGLIKMFTRELPEPLLSFDLFDSWINAVNLPSVQEQLDEMKRLLGMISVNNRNCLARIVQFFARVAQSPATKMTPSNIAISFGMNLMRMRPEVEDAMKLAQSTKSINKVCELLVVHCNELFGVSVKLNQYRGTIYLRELGLTKVLERLSDMQIVEDDEETDTASESIDNKDRSESPKDERPQPQNLPPSSSSSISPSTSPSPPPPATEPIPSSQEEQQPTAAVCSPQSTTDVASN